MSKSRNKLTELQTLVWKRHKKSTVELTRELFYEMVDRDMIGAHSLLLYVYDCFYYQRTVWDRLRFFLDMRNSAKVLSSGYDGLNLSQTNILLNYLVRHALWPSDNLKSALLDQALRLTESTAVTHNTVLTHILKAEMLVKSGSLYNTDLKDAILEEIKVSNNLVENHLLRSNDLETLRHTVLIYERISDIHGSLGNKVNQLFFLRKAFGLAATKACIYDSIITTRLSERINELEER